LRALRRNRLQTSLTVIGMMIGVAAVLAMIAIGSGARTAIEDQIRAAGMNLIIVTAGNYKVKTTDDFGGGAVEPSAALRDEEPSGGPERPAPRSLVVGRPFQGRQPGGPDQPPPRLRQSAVASAKAERPALRSLWEIFEPVLLAHPEDNPMEKHDHPTARQRLGDGEAGLGSAATLLPSDAGAIRKIRGVQSVAEGIHQNVHVKNGAKRWFTRLHGTDQQLPVIRRAWVFSRGRFFSAREQARSEQVIVLGSFAAERLFGAEDPIGRDVTLWNQPFRVVGVLTTTSWMIAPAAGDDQFDAVYIPFPTMHRLLNLTKLNDITVTAVSTGEVTRIMTEVTALLRARHQIADNMADDFTVTTQARQALARGGLRPDVARAVVGNVAGLEKVTLEQLGRTLDRATATMALLLAAIAAVSLLVGGIGIMNVMLLSITDRTREIGIRRASGARARDIRSQFVIEAMVLSLAGGIMGVSLGLAAAAGLSRYLKWSTTVSPGAVLLSVGVAAAVGIFFGWFPARQAAALDPIQSLRRE
jgi:putative ABC transport system permease protein